MTEDFIIQIYESSIYSLLSVSALLLNAEHLMSCTDWICLAALVLRVLELKRWLRCVLPLTQSSSTIVTTSWMAPWWRVPVAAETSNVVLATAVECNSLSKVNSYEPTCQFCS